MENSSPDLAREASSSARLEIEVESSLDGSFFQKQYLIVRSSSCSKSIREDSYSSLSSKSVGSVVSVWIAVAVIWIALIV